MALLADIDKDSYTRTGKGMLMQLGNKLSVVPFVGGFFTGILGLVDTAIETAQQLFRGKFLSAATVAASGAVGTAVNTIGGTVFWGANVASGGLTGVTLGTHARAATETVIGGITGALGMKPTVLRSYQAGIGSIGGGSMQSGPGKFASGVSAERGQNANDAYARYMSGEGGVHINELQSANGRGA